MAERKRQKSQNSTRVMTSGTVIRLEQPKSKRKPKPSAARVVVEEVRPVRGFTDFLREYTIVSLAIGFVIATQVQGLVKLLVAGFIDPLSQLLTVTALSQRTFTLHFHGRHADFAWGNFVYGLVDFLFVLVVIYIIVKLFNLDKLNKPKNKK